MNDLAAAARLAERVARHAGALLRARPTRVEHKGAIDLVTEVDLASEARIREDLARELRRIKAEPQVREVMRRRMHQGMTVVTTNAPSRPEHRSGKDFVVIDGIY